jgi:hypothetical protein
MLCWFPKNILTQFGTRICYIKWWTAVLGGETYFKSMHTNKCADKIGWKHTFLPTGPWCETGMHLEPNPLQYTGKYSDPLTYSTFCYVTALF